MRHGKKFFTFSDAGGKGRGEGEFWAGDPLRREKVRRGRGAVPLREETSRDKRQV